MELSQFDFHLPDELIAQTPLEERSSSRLLFYDRSTEDLEHQQFSDIVDIFGENDVIVLNKSKVLPARIAFENKEIFLVEPVRVDVQQNTWKCLVRKGKFFGVGKEITFVDGTIAKVLQVEGNGMRHIQFFSANFSLFLGQFGEMPLPPYIHTKLENEDRYQTIFAEDIGSVAAPTAGLHFTTEILQQLQHKGVQIEYVTLHVGPGTFLPVKADHIEDHVMHAEYFELSAEVATRLNAARAHGKKVTAVGSTALRTLESCVGWMDCNQSLLQATSGKTDLFLYPPAKFHIVDHFLTNFHLPKSTLFMLVAAFLSPGQTDGIQTIRKIYNEAIQQRYRFFSFGDATLFW